MDSTQPFYRQLYGRFYLLVFAFVIVLGVGFGLYLLQAQQITQLQTQHIAKLRQHNKIQQLIIDSEHLTSNITQSDKALGFTLQHQQITNNLTAIVDITRKRKREIERVLNGHRALAENVTRLEENDRRNQQLKDSVIIQLTLISERLLTVIKAQSTRQRSLYQQITSDRLTDRVTAVRAKAHAIVARSLNQNRQTHRRLIDTLVMFGQLNLQYPLDEFDYIQQQINSVLASWLESSQATANLGKNEQALIGQMQVLNSMLFIEQTVFAKWRGQLRLAADYFAQLHRQNKALSPLLNAFDENTLKITLGVEQSIQQLSTKWGLEFEPRDLHWLIIFVFCFPFLCFVYTVFNLQRRIKHFGQSLVDSITPATNSNAMQVNEFTSLEGKEIVAKIQQLVLPQHSEVDYQAQKAQSQQRLAVIYTHNNTAFWQLPLAPNIDGDNDGTLTELLAKGLPVTSHWRHWFSVTDVQQIIQQARQAKSTSRVQTIELISLSGIELIISIEFCDGHWQGCLNFATESKQLRLDIAQLKQALVTVREQQLSSMLENSDDVANMVVRAMLEYQMATSDDTAAKNRGYRQLVQLYDWCRQHKISAQLRQDNYSLGLSTVDFANEIRTAFANISVDASVRHNTVSMLLSENLASLVVIESGLFQRLLVGIANSLLVEQFNCHLSFDVQVIENRADQQMIRLSFAVHGTSNVKKLTETVNQLALDIASERNESSKTLAYLQDLMLVHNVNNKQSVGLDDGAKLCLDMLMVNGAASLRQNNDRCAGLTDKNILILAADADNGSRINAAFDASKANTETLKDISQLSGKLRVKYSNNRVLDAVVVSPEVHLSDHDLIVKCINSLPAKLQPKLLVIQPAFNAPFHRTGMFSLRMLPWLHDELGESLLTLLSADQRSNVVVDAEIMMQYRHRATQVEVLLAVKDPQQHSTLICLLHWLGLQIKVVCHRNSMDKHWQSGRYLILIAEFCSSPVATMTIGSQLPRGAFYFAKPEFANHTPPPESWSIAQFPDSMDIQAISELLAPWLSSERLTAPLKSKISLVNDNNSISDFSENISAGVDNIVDIAKSQTLVPTLPEQQNATVDELLQGDVQAGNDNPVFDLAAYARNQGSAELAVFMLDEYLMDIEKYMSALNDAITSRQVVLAQEALKMLLKLMQILAAEKYRSQCLRLETILSNNSKSKITLTQQKALQLQFKQLKIAQTQLFDFAQAI